MEAMSHLRRVHLHLSDGPNTMEQRRLHNSQWGYLCPVETPDGGSIGQHKHFAQTCTVSQEHDPEKLTKWVTKTSGFHQYNKKDFFNPSHHNVFVNGSWIGVQEKPKEFVEAFRAKRSDLKDSVVHWSFSIAWNIKDCDICILTTGGRLMRPLRMKSKPSFEDKNLELLGPIPEVMIEHGCEYIDPSEADTILVSYDSEDPVCTHVEITKTSILGLTALTLPFLEHNPIARNLYATQQARAAVSLYAANFNSRVDQKASLLHYGQCPITHTGVVAKLNQNKAPFGINIIVAIAACTGYNQEDAIIINKSAIESGLFTSSYLTTFSLREEVSQGGGGKSSKSAAGKPTEKTASTTGNIHIGHPKKAYKEILNIHQHWDYSLLDENGIIRPGSLVTPTTVLVGSYKVDKKGNFVDNSLVASHAHDHTYVERVYLSKTFPRIAKIVTSEIRFPIVGDKFASRAAQKAVIGIIVPKENMPYTRDGIVPDIIFNPHSFPSRMTIAYFLEMLTGQIGLDTGRLVEVSSFTGLDYPHETFINCLKKIGGDPNSEQKLYSGTTGELVCKDACMGPIFYQRLKQMVGDKIYARGVNGPKDAITKQPLGGRARGGGLKCGEMERDALLSHGMSQFVKEMYWDKSDAFEMVVDTESGIIVPHNPDKGIYHTGPTSHVQVPYAFKLFLQEIQSMGISCKIGVEEPV